MSGAQIQRVDHGYVNADAFFPFPDLLPALRGEPTPDSVLGALTPMQRERHLGQVELIKRDLARIDRANRTAARAALQARMQASGQGALL